MNRADRIVLIQSERTPVPVQPVRVCGSHLELQIKALLLLSRNNRLGPFVGLLVRCRRIQRLQAGLDDVTNSHCHFLKVLSFCRLSLGIAQFHY